MQHSLAHSAESGNQLSQPGCQGGLTEGQACNKEGAGVLHGQSGLISQPVEHQARVRCLDLRLRSLLGGHVMLKVQVSHGLPTIHSEAPHFAHPAATPAGCQPADAGTILLGATRTVGMALWVCIPLTAY